MACSNHFNIAHSFAALWRRAAIVGCLVVLVSCSAEKRLQRLIKKHPELVKKDTVYVRDTVITESIKTDTFFVFKPYKTTDTFYIEKEKLKVQIIRQRDTIRANAEVKSDTIYVEKKVPIDNVIVKYDYVNPILNKLFYLSLILLLLFLIIKFEFYDKRKN